MLALAWIISRYAKRIHAAGALYDYVGEGFGKPTGLFAGWVYYGGAFMLTMAIGLAFGGFASLTLPASTTSTSTGSGSPSRSGSWRGRSRVLGVQISTRAQLVLALVSVAVIFAWAIYVLLKGGSSGFSLQPFNPGKSRSPASPTASSTRADLRRLRVGREPRRGDRRAQTQHPAGDLLSVLAAAVFYVVLAWALILAFGSTSATC